MKRKLIWGCIAPLVAVVSIGYLIARSLGSVAPAAARTETAAVGDVEIKVIETGTIEPLTKVEIKSKAAGRLSRLFVEEGDRVAKGQLLAEIDPTEVNSQVGQIRAQLDGAVARLEQAKRSVTYQQEQTASDIAQAREALRQAESRLRQAIEENKVEPQIVESDLAQAQAALQTARENLALLRSVTHPQTLVQATAQYEEAKVEEQNATRAVDRQRNLLAKGFASEQAVDAAISQQAAAKANLQQAARRQQLIAEQNRREIANAENAVKNTEAQNARALLNRSHIRIRQEAEVSARAAVQQARAQLRAAQSGVRQDRMRQDDVLQARSAVVQIQNQLREYQVRQGDTRLVATMAGTVVKRYMEQGELVTSGVSTFSSGTPVMRIADLSRMLIKMTVNEVDVHKVQPGLPVEISIDGVRGHIYKGTVRSVSPAAAGSETEQTVTQTGSVVRFAVEVIVTTADERLRPGMSAKSVIVVARRKNVLRLPNNCFDGEGASAKVHLASQVVKDGVKTDRFTPMLVRVGLRGDNFTEVLSGIKAGDRVKPNPYTGPPRKSIDIFN